MGRLTAHLTNAGTATLPKTAAAESAISVSKASSSFHAFSARVKYTTSNTIKRASINNLLRKGEADGGGNAEGGVFFKVITAG